MNWQLIDYKLDIYALSARNKISGTWIWVHVTDLNFGNFTMQIKLPEYMQAISSQSHLPLHSHEFLKLKLDCFLCRVTSQNSGKSLAPHFETPYYIIAENYICIHIWLCHIKWDIISWFTQKLVFISMHWLYLHIPWITFIITKGSNAPYGHLLHTIWPEWL